MCTKWKRSGTRTCAYRGCRSETVTTTSIKLLPCRWIFWSWWQRSEYDTCQSGSCRCGSGSTRERWWPAWWELLCHGTVFSETRVSRAQSRYNDRKPSHKLLKLFSPIHPQQSFFTRERFKCNFIFAVNTASRMESSSLPMRIQISEATKNLLDKWKSYSIQSRGEMDVKVRIATSRDTGDRDFR